MIYQNKLTNQEVYKRIKFERDYPVLVRTVQGETRSGTWKNASNVAHCILNRVRKQRPVWGMNVKAVCLKANSKGVHQYSYWDKTQLKYLSYHYVDRLTPFMYEAIRDWSNGLDYVDGATHYHTHDTHPDWAEGHISCIQDDMHLFYNDIY